MLAQALKKKKSGSRRKHVRDFEKKTYSEFATKKNSNKGTSFNLPLQIHSREAEEDTFAILERHLLNKEHKLHCHAYFNSDWMIKKLMMEYPNCYIGIS